MCELTASLLEKVKNFKCLCVAEVTLNLLRLKKKVEICGVIEEVTFEYKNVPKSTRLEDESNTLSVFDRIAVDRWKEEEKEVFEKHGEEAGREIMKNKRAILLQQDSYSA